MERAREDQMQADTSTRLRLVEISTPGGHLRIGGGFACVLAPPHERRTAARWIAATVAGPRPPGGDGTIEIAGRFVAARCLPSPLLAPSAPSVVDCVVLRAQWRTVWDRRCAELDAAHAARRFERHRAEAALDRARARAHARVTGARTAGSGPVERPGARAEHISELRARLDALQPVPVRAALALADELAAVQGRVDAAQRARAATGRSAIGRGHLEALHREVVAAEAAVSEARRRERSAALARYEAAVRAEQEALAAAGFDSFAAFLVAVAQGAVPAPAAETAEVERAEAEAALTAAPALRARAARLLGHVPGDDASLVDGLRALRVEHPDAAPLRAELAALLERSHEQPVTLAPVQAVANDAPEELGRLARERDLHADALEQLEAELARLDAARDADITALEPGDLALALTALLDAYRRGDLLAGRLPLVFDGTFDGLHPASRRAALDVLAAALDVQPIVVTHDPAVADVARDAGAATLAWPPGPELEPTDRPTVEASRRDAGAPRASGAHCPEHTDAASVATCARCGRACCIDCLVYVIGEPGLWCAPCARGAGRPQSGPARLLRRRA